MDRVTVIEQLEALAEGFNYEYNACPVAIYEAIRLLKEGETDEKE